MSEIIKGEKKSFENTKEILGNKGFTPRSPTPPKLDTHKFSEPKIHSDISYHYYNAEGEEYDCIYCESCNEMVHLGCLRDRNQKTWVETGKGNFCLKCFIEHDSHRNKEPFDSIDDEWAICVPISKEEAYEQLTGYNQDKWELVDGCLRLRLRKDGNK